LAIRSPYPPAPRDLRLAYRHVDIDELPILWFQRKRFGNVRPDPAESRALPAIAGHLPRH